MGAPEESRTPRARPNWGQELGSETKLFGLDLQLRHYCGLRTRTFAPKSSLQSRYASCVALSYAMDGEELGSG